MKAEEQVLYGYLEPFTQAGKKPAGRMADNLYFDYISSTLPTG